MVEAGTTETRLLVGRDEQLARTVEAIARPDARLVTLTGRRGVGKTRLAAAAAAAAPAPHHVVALEGAADRAEHVARIAEALGAEAASLAAIHARLDAGAVVVLDGSPSAAVTRDLVEELLDGSDGLTVLSTAAEPLGRAGEIAIDVPLLGLPAPAEVDPKTIAKAPAVALFLQATGRSAAEDADLSTIAELCRRLDGVPQAILLAAARLSLMDPSTMLAEMSRIGARRLVGLTIDDEVARSLRGLDATTTTVLRAMACMAGGATLEAIAAVADVPDAGAVEAVDALVRAHLALADRRRGRHSLLGSAVEHAGLGSDADAASLELRHATFFAAQARAFGRRPHGSPMDPAWLLDHHNRLRALATLRATGDHEGALRLVVDAMPGFEHRGEPRHGRALLNDVLSETPDRPSGACIQAHTWLGRLGAESDDAPRTAARGHFETALRLARERGDLVIHLEVLNTICENQVTLDDGVEMCEAAVAEALALVEAPELDFARSVFLCWHAANLHRRGRMEEGIAAITEAMEAARRYGDRRLVMSYAIVHWQFPREVRRDDAGVPSLIELLEMAQSQGDPRVKGWVWIVLVHSAIEDGDLRTAILHGLGMLRLARATIQAPIARQALTATLRLLSRHPDPALAARIAGALSPRAAGVEAHLPPRFVADVRRSVAEARTALGDEAFAAGRAEGLRAGAWELLDEAERWLAATLDRLVPAALDGAVGGAALERLAELTPRETEVLVALAGGGSNKEIAMVLGTRPKTVAHHCASIYAKLDVRNRTEAVAELLRRRAG